MKLLRNILPSDSFRKSISILSPNLNGRSDTTAHGNYVMCVWLLPGAPELARALTWLKIVLIRGEEYGHLDSVIMVIMATLLKEYLGSADLYSQELDYKNSL